MKNPLLKFPHALACVLLVTLVTACATGSTAVRAEATPSVTNDAASSLERAQTRRSPYGLAYRVGYGYAYRHWTW